MMARRRLLRGGVSQPRRSENASGGVVRLALTPGTQLAREPMSAGEGMEIKTRERVAWSLARLLAVLLGIASFVAYSAHQRDPQVHEAVNQEAERGLEQARKFAEELQAESRSGKRP
jgi:hypothetical protein